MPKVRAVYDVSTRSYRGTASNLIITDLTSRGVKPAADALMNGSPFGPFNPNQPVDGSPYRDPDKLKALAKV